MCCMNLSLNLSLFQLSFNELSLYEYESSDELGIYLRCTCTSMADNNLLTMDPTDDSSFSLTLSISTKKLRWWHVYPAHSERGVTPSYYHEDKHDGLLRSYTLSISLISWHRYRYTLVMCFALQYLRESRSQCSQDKIACLRFFRSPIDSLTHKGCELSRWVSKLVLNGRLGELWSNEILDSIVNHRYPDDFFSLDIGKDVAHNSTFESRACVSVKNSLFLIGGRRWNLNVP